jgi:hypothetical protein
MWLSLSISNDANIFKNKDESNRKLAININNEEKNFDIINPTMIVIEQKKFEGINIYEFKNIEADDMKYLNLSSNASFDRNAKKLTVYTNNNENLIISFKKEQYWFSMIITIAAWLMLLSFLIVYNYTIFCKNCAPKS